jgi:uncharacterized protein (TIGR00255 family)
MPIKSMTAFGSGEINDNGSSYICEVKTLNSRFIEVNVRLPRFLWALETEVIARVKEVLTRGKVDISFIVQSQDPSGTMPRINEKVLENYLQMISAAQKKFNMSDSWNDIPPPDMVRILQLEGVMDTGATERSAEIAARHKKPLLAALSEALAAVDKARKQEGDVLLNEFGKLIGEISASREAMQALSGEITKSMHASYVERLQDLQLKIAEAGLKGANELPQDRLLLEVGILIDKSDITEELTRLKAHEEEFKRLLADKTREPAGRRLDFLSQEMQREVNTISNKLVVTQASAHSRNIKHTIEKIKQQIQNIE